MAVTTVFLGVLIGALIIGNGLLFLFERRKGSGAGARIGGVNFSTRDVEGEPYGERAVGFAPMDRKVELAHMRIQAIEDRLGKAVADDSLIRKVEKLDNFRSTVEAELIGIKEIIGELQKNSATAKHVKKRRAVFSGKKQVKHPSGKAVHKLIYNSNGKKRKR